MERGVQGVKEDSRGADGQGWGALLLCRMGGVWVCVGWGVVYVLSVVYMYVWLFRHYFLVSLFF